MSTVVHTTVLFWCHIGLFLEQLYEVALGREGQVGCDLNHGDIAEPEEVLGLFYLDFPDIIAGGDMHLTLKKPGDIAGGIAAGIGQILNGYALLDMGIDIVYALCDGPGECCILF